MNRKSFFEKVIAFITSFVFVASVAGASVALAALTFSNVAVTTDSFLSLLGGLVGMGGNATSSSMLYVQSQGVGTSTVYLQGLAGQTANLLTIASSTGVNLFTIGPTGNVSTTGNVTIGGTFQSNAGQSTFGSVSSTNLFVNGYLTVATTSPIFLANLNGQVIIGTSTAGAGNALLTIATSSNIFTVFSNGRVGIGTTDPGTKLHVVGTFPTNGGVQTGLILEESTNGSTSILMRNTAGPSAAMTESAGSIIFYGTSTMNNLVAGDEKLRITATGNVGIGTTQPSSTLHIISNAVGTPSLQISGFLNQTADLLTIASSTGLSFFSVNSTGQMLIATSSAPASTTLFTIATSSQIFNINSFGNVMIGTSTAAGNALLTIATSSAILTIDSAGNVSSTGNLTVGGRLQSNAGQSTFGAVSSTNLSASGYLTVTGSSTFGGGSQIAKIFCAHSYTNVGAVASNATGTVGLTLTGISTSSAQSFSWGTNATGGMAYGLQLMNVVPSSTANNVDLVIRNISSAALPSQSTLFTVCGMQQ